MIKGMSEVRRCPRLGHIRLGIKKISQKSGKEYPAEVDYFILDPQTGDFKRNERLKTQFKEFYGEKPTAIKIMFPPAGPEIFFQQWYKRYGSGTLLKCKGDGEVAICASQDFAEGLEVIGKDEMGLTKVKCLGPECIYQKDGSCRRLGALQVLLPELSGIGVWQINTGSWNSIVNLNSALDWLKGLCGRYYMIPVTLIRVPTDIAYEGKKSKHYIMQIDMNVSITQLQQAALIAPEKAALGALPAPDETKDELLYPEVENGNANNDKETGGAIALTKPKQPVDAPEAGAKETLEKATQENLEKAEEESPFRQKQDNGIFAKPEQIEAIIKLCQKKGLQDEDIKFKASTDFRVKKTGSVKDVLFNLTKEQAAYWITQLQRK